jgi:hypothetical protein
MAENPASGTSFWRFWRLVASNPTGSPGDPSSNRVVALLVLFSGMGISWKAALDLGHLIRGAAGDADIASAAMYLVLIIACHFTLSALALGIATWDKIQGVVRAWRGSEQNNDPPPPSHV